MQGESRRHLGMRIGAPKKRLGLPSAGWEFICFDLVIEEVGVD